MDEERELRLQIMRQELRVLLWQRVAIPDALVHVAADLGGSSTWQALKACGDAPPRITIGRRRFVLVSDLRRWLEGRPKTQMTPAEVELLDHDDADKLATTRSSATFADPLGPRR